MHQVYLPGQLQTLVAIVISVIHLVVPLSQDHPAHHHSQVDALGPEVKLLHLQREDGSTVWNEVRRRRDSTCELSYRDVGEDQGCQELPRLLHLGLLRTPPHALPSYFIAQVPQGLGHNERTRGQHVAKWHKYKNIFLLHGKKRFHISKDKSLTGKVRFDSLRETYVLLTFLTRY